jgi:hypothetical protein
MRWFGATGAPTVVSTAILAACGAGVLLACAGVVGDLLAPQGATREYPSADAVVTALILGMHLAALLVYVAFWHRGRALAGWTGYLCTGLALGAYLHHAALNAELGP